MPSASMFCSVCTETLADEEWCSREIDFDMSWINFVVAVDVKGRTELLLLYYYCFLIPW